MDYASALSGMDSSSGGNFYSFLLSLPIALFVMFPLIRYLIFANTNFDICSFLHRSN